MLKEWVRDASKCQNPPRKTEGGKFEAAEKAAVRVWFPPLEFRTDTFHLVLCWRLQTSMPRASALCLFIFSPLNSLSLSFGSLKSIRKSWTGTESSWEGFWGIEHMKIHEWGSEGGNFFELFEREWGSVRALWERGMWRGIKIFETSYRNHWGEWGNFKCPWLTRLRIAA